jgi:hypothetical protein
LKQNEDYNLRYYRLLENELINHPNTKLYLKIKLFNRGVGYINNLDTLNLFYSKLIGV